MMPRRQRETGGLPLLSYRCRASQIRRTVPMPLPQQGISCGSGRNPAENGSSEPRPTRCGVGALGLVVGLPSIMVQSLLNSTKTQENLVIFGDSMTSIEIEVCNRLPPREDLHSIMISSCSACETLALISLLPLRRVHLQSLGAIRTAADPQRAASWSRDKVLVKSSDPVC
jgi:hypothetical protein